AIDSAANAARPRSSLADHDGRRCGDLACKGFEGCADRLMRRTNRSISKGRCGHASQPVAYKIENRGCRTADSGRADRSDPLEIFMLAMSTQHHSRVNCGKLHGLAGKVQVGESGMLGQRKPS